MEHFEKTGPGPQDRGSHDFDMGHVAESGQFGFAGGGEENGASVQRAANASSQVQQLKAYQNAANKSGQVAQLKSYQKAAGAVQRSSGKGVIQRVQVQRSTDGKLFETTEMEREEIIELALSFYQLHNMGELAKIQSAHPDLPISDDQLFLLASPHKPSTSEGQSKEPQKKELAESSTPKKPEPIADHHTSKKGAVPAFMVSENALYFIFTADPTSLFSLETSDPPKPNSIYTGRKVQGQLNSKPTTFIKWTPNVEFLSKGENRTAMRLDAKITGAGTTRAYESPVGNVDIGSKIQGIVDRMMEKNPALVSRPTSGVLGANDCAIFAQNLQRMVREQLEVEGIKPSPQDRVTMLNVIKDKLPDLQIGDAMIHEFEPSKGEERDCGWHGATVIAQDGSSSITLEAHAGKDITRPEFHLRNGILGFVRDNNTKYDDGGNPSSNQAGGNVRFLPRMHESTDANALFNSERLRMGRDLVGKGDVDEQWRGGHVEITLMDVM